MKLHNCTDVLLHVISTKWFASLSKTQLALCPVSPQRGLPLSSRGMWEASLWKSPLCSQNDAYSNKQLPSHGYLTTHVRPSGAIGKKLVVNMSWTHFKHHNADAKMRWTTVKTELKTEQDWQELFWRACVKDFCPHVRLLWCDSHSDPHTCPSF